MEDEFQIGVSISVSLVFHETEGRIVTGNTLSGLLPLFFFEKKKKNSYVTGGTPSGI